MKLDPGRWQRLRAVFHGALDQRPIDRARYVDRACAEDRSLVAEVQVLLDAHERAGAFLESPVVATALSFSGSPSGLPSVPAPGVSREGQIISHYQIGPKLGAGGMGVVYQAADLALGRSAALKLLPDAFSPSLLDRLRSEADACARLQHPAIATYYESGEWHGTAFIAMELVPGRTLRSYLQVGALPFDQAMAVTGCVLEALSHAHAAGILHRDIKPDNIILTGPHAAKLLDFGLAKSLVMTEATDLARASLSGESVAGTVGYMSPEQIRNEPLDMRSDIFQAGAVLYEMLSGRPAFPGTTVAERLAAVLTKDPAPIAGSTPYVAAHAVVARALARHPARRYPTAASMHADLLRISAGEWSVDLPDSIAVLDFRNLVASPEDDWIGSGVAESASLTFGRTPGIVLAPRDRSQRAFRAARSETADAIAVEVGLSIGCRWVLTGTYQRLGPALRITTDLFEVSTGARVGGEQIDGTLEQIFDLQDRIVAATCATLAVEAAANTGAQRTVLSAYECYARGRREAVKYERGAFDRAREFYDKAVGLDPGYALALTGLSHTYAMRYTYTTDPSVLEKAFAFGKRAIEADPTLAEAYIWFAYALRRMERHEEADAALELARKCDPSQPYGYYFAAVLPHWRRNPDRALAMLQCAVERDPLWGFAWWGLGAVHCVERRYSEASSCFERCARLYSIPNGLPIPGIEGYLAECFRRTGRLVDARAQCLAGLESAERSDFMYRDTTRIFCLVSLGNTAREQGDRDAARAAFEQAIAQIKGRARTLGGGTLFVRALAGLARLTGDRSLYREACVRFAQRDEFDFSWVWMGDDCDTYLDLADAARAFNLSAEAVAFVERSRST